jgi:sigma-E factor negative regulatory protein RseA
MVMEKLSAYMDGEAERFEEQQMLAQLDRDAGARETWETWHLIGDALRGEPALQAGFTQRLSERLAAEPTVLAPRRSWRRPVRYALSAAASLAAVAFVVTLVYQGSPLEPGAVAQRPVTVAAVPTAAERGPESGYLLAHQEFSPSSVYGGVAPYVRTVSAGPDAGR